MPQTTQELRDEFNNDGVAWDYLNPNFVEERFLIRPKLGHFPTEKDQRAIRYLVEEWDWEYSNEPYAG